VFLVVWLLCSDIVQFTFTLIQLCQVFDEVLNAVSHFAGIIFAIVAIQLMWTVCWIKYHQNILCYFLNYCTMVYVGNDIEAIVHANCCYLVRTIAPDSLHIVNTVSVVEPSMMRVQRRPAHIHMSNGLQISLLFRNGQGPDTHFQDYGSRGTGRTLLAVVAGTLPGHAQWRIKLLHRLSTFSLLDHTHLIC